MKVESTSVASPPSPSVPPPARPEYRDHAPATFPDPLPGPPTGNAPGTARTVAGLPNLFLIGAQKAGTTWLARCMDTRDAVFLPPDKEPHYFDRPTGDATAAARELERYRSIYANARAPWRMDATPNYLAHPDAPARVADSCPDASLIVTLRDPVERAISATRHHLVRERYAPDATVDSVLRDLLDGAEDRHRVLAASRYHESLGRWERYFERSRFCHVVFESDIEVLDGQPAADRVAEFLDLEPFTVPYAAKQFRSPTARSRLAGKVLVAMPFVARVLGPINGWLSEPAHFEASGETRHRLAAALSDDREALEEMIGRDLSVWAR